MVFCKNCGYELDNESEFCPECGFPLTSKAILYNKINKNNNNFLILSIIGVILSIINIPLSIYYYFKDIAITEYWLKKAINTMSQIDTTYAPYLNQENQEFINNLYNRLLNDISMFATGSIIFIISSIFGVIGVCLFYTKNKYSTISFIIGGIFNLLIGLYFATFNNIFSGGSPYYVNEFHIIGIISLISAIIFLLIAYFTYRKKII